MKPPLFILYMDRYHAGDPLFVKELARRLAGPPGAAPPCLLVHGSGEKVERTLESEGLFIERAGGVLQVEEPAHVRLVERAVRESNKELVAALTDEGVSAVGVQGVDRSLLRLAEAGAVATGRAAWVQDLVSMHVVPVISALAQDAAGRVREVAAAEAARALAGALEARAATVVFFTRNGRPGLPGVEAETVAPTAPPTLLAETDALPEPEAARQLANANVPMLLTNLDGFFASEEPRGTRGPA